MKAGKGFYLAYLLRLWRVRQGGAWVWMASLESTATGQRYGFASLEAMLAFLNLSLEQVDQLAENPAQTGKELASEKNDYPEEMG